MSKKYKRTTELNDKQSPSTGSCTAFYGKSPWKGFKSPYMFFEVADCGSKIRLHNSQIDSRKSFIEKIKRLRNELDRFIVFLDDVYASNYQNALIFELHKCLGGYRFDAELGTLTVLNYFNVR